MMEKGRITLWVIDDQAGGMVGQFAFSAEGGGQPQLLGDPVALKPGVTMWVDPSCIECELISEVGSGETDEKPPEPRAADQQPGQATRKEETHAPSKTPPTRHPGQQRPR